MTTQPTGTSRRSERTLTLVRHASAENVQDRSDHSRKLLSRGRKDAQAVGVWLSRSPLAAELDLALCSTSERTRQTLDNIRAGGASVKDARFDDRIYNASAVGLLEVLREVPDSVSSLLMVGHAPGIPVLATALAREDPASTEVMDQLSLAYPTSGVAILGFDGPWAELAPEAAYLMEFAVPRAESER
jgi:phosphohistidine phosphatase